MPESNGGYATLAKPDHVPDNLVVDFDFRHFGGSDVYAMLQFLQDGPDIRWTPCNGGHWIVTRAEDIRWVQESSSIFSVREFMLPRGISLKMPPMSVDPPHHARYRALFNPFFTPSKVAEMSTRARTIVVDLIETFKRRGQCEFVSEFAQVVPAMVFFEVVGLPLSRRQEFAGWIRDFTDAQDEADRDHAYQPIAAYLKVLLDERYSNPSDDFMSSISAWRNNPRFCDESEIIGMAQLIFSAGLDTVTSMLSFIALHLAQHPEHRRRLRAEPDVIPRAAEEFLRRYGLSNTSRLILQDVERKGAMMKAGDMVLVSTALSSIDEREYSNPLMIDFDRPENFVRNLPAHNTFGNGPHKCVGSPLARAEVCIFLEEWLRLIPDFELDPDHKPRTYMDHVNGIDSLYLRWEA